MAGRVSQIAIAKVGPEAAELLSKIHQECFPSYWNIDSFNNFFSVANTHAWVVGQHAMIVLRIAGEQADIITLAVLPAYRRQGLARALVQGALAEARAAGAVELFLDVEEGNDPAIRLYESFGFAYLRRRKLYYQKPDGTYTDALVMMKRL